MLSSGLIGRAIQGSRSPWLHEQEARAQGLALSYNLFDFDELGLADSELPGFLAELRERNFCGVNVTYPFKQAVIPLLDGLADSAMLVGAVNTIAIRDGRLTGYNTDMSGFADSVREGLAGAAMTRVVQLGAGGAGSAVACALLSLGVDHLDIYDLERERAVALAATLGDRFGIDRVVACSDLSTVADKADGVVNATPLGMAAHPQSAIPSELIKPVHWVADIVYFPLETELLRLARAKGCRVLNGSGMVIAQAAEAFQIMTGHAADTARMRASFGLA